MKNIHGEFIQFWFLEQTNKKIWIYFHSRRINQEAADRQVWKQQTLSEMSWHLGEATENSDQDYLIREFSLGGVCVFTNY